MIKIEVLSDKWQLCESFANKKGLPDFSAKRLLSEIKKFQKSNFY